MLNSQAPQNTKSAKTPTHVATTSNFEQHNEEKETGRTEAFSDGVFAIAVTLLVLNIVVPVGNEIKTEADLAQALLDQWPIYVSYLITFINVFLLWEGHHVIFTYIKRTDHTFSMINGLLLLGVTILPFPASLLAHYLQHPGVHLALEIYTAICVVNMFFFCMVWFYASHKKRLIDHRSDPAVLRIMNQHFLLGLALLGLSFVAAFFSAFLSLAVYILIIGFFIMPSAAHRRGAMISIPEPTPVLEPTLELEPASTQESASKPEQN
jgi:uncharacterized membrane protein